MKLYGSKPTEKNYLADLHDHLISNNYQQSEAHSYIKYHHLTYDSIIIYVTIDEFLVIVPSENDIIVFYHYLIQKYEVKNLRK